MSLIDRLPPEARSPRQVARTLVDGLRTRDPALLAFAGIDLGPAVEQQLYVALRDGTAPSRLAAARDLALLPAVTAGRVLGAFARVPHGAPAVLLRESIHGEAVAAIDARLAERGLPRSTVVTVGRAARPGEAIGVPLGVLVRPGDIGHLWYRYALLAARLGPATTEWGGPGTLSSLDADRLRRVAHSALLRCAVGAAALMGLAARGPSVIAAFDEKGSWARLIGPVGRAFGIPTLDIPHAEAAGPEAIQGADYDRMAVYGPRSAGVLRQAGIPAHRVIEVGAPRFDAIAARGAAQPTEPRRVVLAGQYVAGMMTTDRLVVVLNAALAAAAAIGAVLEAVPHPAEPRGSLRRMLFSIAPRDANWEIGDRGLHDALDDAWLLVTGWSNSVLEAAIRRVPALVVAPGGVSPVRYDLDGLAIGATDPPGAAEAARWLLEPGTRATTVERARAVLAEHIGPLDARASERVAALMEQMAAEGS